MNYGILPNLTKDYILSKISQEQIFEKYLGISVEFNTLLKAPAIIRTNDRNPTCSFYYSSNGKLRFRDFGGNYFWGDCFDIVALVHRLNAQNKKDFNLILDIVARDFRIHKYENSLNIDTGSTYDVRDVKGKKEKSKVEFKVKPREWYQQDARFWQQGNITKKYLDLFDVHPCMYIWKNDTLIYNFNPKDPAYAYRFGKGEFKFYFPFRKEYRFLSNTSVLQGFKQFEPAEIGLITKSYKDVISLKTFGISSVAPSSETHLISKSQWLDLKPLAEHWFSLMDYDRAGILMAQKLRKAYNIHPLFFAREFRQGELRKLIPTLYANYKDFGNKDFFEYVTKFGKPSTIKLIDETKDLFKERFESLDTYYYNNLNWLKTYETSSFK